MLVMLATFIAVYLFASWLADVRMSSGKVDTAQAAGLWAAMRSDLDSLRGKDL